jgi:hypothetical protein
MSRETQDCSTVRCLGVWSLVATATLALPLALQRELALAGSLLHGGPAGMPFDRLLTAGCAVALTACAVWFWAVTTLTVALALRGHVGRVPGCPDGVRRLVLVACGLAVLATASPATADQTAGSPPTPDPAHALSGLPYPDRASVGPAPPRPESTATVRVRPDDTLWGIARRQLPADARPGAIDQQWRAIWRANRSAIGSDPDLILPGSALRLPTPKES